jgi:pectate lyase
MFKLLRSEKTISVPAILLVCAFMNYAYPPVAIPDGFAKGTTGGGNANPKVVKSASGFKSAVSGDEPAVIIVEGRFSLGGAVTIGSNKTIIGADTQAGIYGGTVKSSGKNIIIQNISFGPSGGDVMEFSGASKIFVKNCEFHDSSDELLSIVRGSDWVTICWSKFYFDNPGSHSFAHLIGNRDDATGDRGKLHVTLHHNWYTKGIRGRIPRVRFGEVHIYNNYIDANGTGYCIGTGKECHIRVESVHFDGVDGAWTDYGGKSNGEIGWKDLEFTGGTTQPDYMPNKYPVFELPYSYSADSVKNVKDIVTGGAGNKIPNPTYTIVLKSSHDTPVTPFNSLSKRIGLVQLYDFSGRLIVSNSSSEFENKFLNNRLPAGAYIIKYPLSNSRSVIKWSINE